jgi:UDP-N-acetylglucosamine 2-epimerase (non-hydrolysing)
VFFKEMGIRKPDHFLDAAEETAATTIGNVIARSDKVMQEVKPDALLLYGDTNSCLSVISAKRRQIPVFHMEAGNRCFDQRVPEELNRKIVDHLSDINLTLTEHARRYLVAEGIPSETVIKTGSSMREVLEFHKKEIEGSNVLDRLALQKHDYLVVSAHREENVDNENNFSNLIESLNGIAEHYSRKVIVSTHPRTREKLESLSDVSFNPLIEFMKPLGFFDYIALQVNAFCTVSDSGTITEESSLLGFPAITIRQAHERPEGMDEGTLIMSGLEKDDVIDAIDVITGQAEGRDGVTRVVKDYDIDNVSKKVVRIILSYTNYVKRTVWREYC